MNMPTQLVPLGNSGLKVPLMGMGTWAWGQKMLWGYGIEYGDKELEEAYQACLKEGINFFDTAEVYGWGNSESLLGKFMKADPSHQRPLIASKFAPMLPWRLTGNSLQKALKKSLTRLGMEKLDLYYLHNPKSLRPIKTWVNAIGDAYEEGLIKSVGVSNYDLTQTQEAADILAKRNIPLACNQIHYSLLHQSPETSGLIGKCREMGIAIVSYMPLAHGLLTGKYTPENPPKGARGKSYPPHQLARLTPLIELMQEIGSSHGDKTPAQVAVNWNISKGTITLVGAKNGKQALQNIGALGWSLTPEEILQLDKTASGLQDIIKAWWAKV